MSAAPYVKAISANAAGMATKAHGAWPMIIWLTPYISPPTAPSAKAGTTVFISVGSASPPAAGNREQSNYELLVYELAAVPEGGVCTTSDPCDANGLCFVETGASSGACRITGRAGGFCRPQANCDPGYISRGQSESMGRLGVCAQEIPPGGDCGGLLHGMRGRQLVPLSSRFTAPTARRSSPWKTAATTGAR